MCSSGDDRELIVYMDYCMKSACFKTTCVVVKPIEVSNSGMKTFLGV